MIYNSFTFENQGTNTYLVYEIASTDKVDSMSLGMLTNNKIQGLASTLFMQVDTTKFIKYNVSAKISVKQFFAGPVNKKRLLGVFTGIVDAMLAAEDYMIDVNSILLDTEYIFADVSTCETVLICLPISNLDVQPIDLATFFKNIMFTTQFDQTENCDHVAKIINYLNSIPVFSLVDFKDLLHTIDQQNSVVVKSAPQPVVPQPVVAQPKPVVAQSQPEVSQPKHPPVQKVNVTPVSTPPTSNAMPKPAMPPVSVPISAPQQSNEKQMSMFYLLQHYNKENAALYKAQKEAKKNGKPVATAPIPQATPKPQKAKPAPAAQKQGFAIPGQAAPNASFAIPGQPTPAPAPSKPVAPVVNRPVTPQPAVQQGVAPQPIQQAQPVQQAQPMVTPQPVVSEGKPLNFGETTVLNTGMLGETTVLNAGMMAQEVPVQPHLIRTKNNERIELNKPVFRIGKEKSYVDYFIGDNTAISRSHANIISRDGEYFVVDTNSTNHTYVNGAMIQSNVETKLEDGTKVRLANEDFEFKLR